MGISLASTALTHIIEGDVDVVSFNLEWIYMHSDRRIVSRRPRGCIKRPAVPRADNLVSVHNSLPERPATMHANIIHRRATFTRVRDADRLPVDLKLACFSGGRQLRLARQSHVLRHSEPLVDARVYYPR